MKNEGGKFSGVGKWFRGLGGAEYSWDGQVRVNEIERLLYTGAFVMTP